ncbi:hypothetical protein F2Q69_00061709 [Brassica cretica]|uniref:Uncharacterized protein n=1 Tax=Brassica cretica TaxID=69181 RepID=A0A8S9RFK1_BRACR|nr:hypothetical protein F2Q69_00061709 [Brassica cretica]
MGHLVRLIVGDWSMLAQGTWKFNIDHTGVKYDVVLKENETYEALVEMVRKKYQVFPSELLLLTYDYPDMMKIPGNYTTPPVEIIEDGDVEFFMAVRMDFVNLTMCVTYGNEDVGHHRTIRREEFGLTEDGTDMHPPKPRPWRGFPAGVTAKLEERLLTIYSKEQVDEIRRNVVRLTRTEISQPREDIRGIRSESGSSDEMDDFTPDAEGIIRLQDEAPNQPDGVNLTLAIARPTAVNEYSGGVRDKGKGKMYEPSVKRNLLMDFEIGSGSGNEELNGGNGQKANYEVDDCDIFGKY